MNIKSPFFYPGLISCMLILLACTKDSVKPENDIVLNENMRVELINTYVEQWNQNNSQKRLEVLKQIWADDGLFIDPFNQRGYGAEHVNSVIENDRNLNPGTTFAIESIKVFEKTGFWTWRMYDENKREIIWGYDYAEIDADGKIKLLVVFTQ